MHLLTSSLVVGGLCCVGFVAWERFGALHPLIPFKLLTDRTVIAALVIAVFHPVAGRIAGCVPSLRPFPSPPLTSLVLQRILLHFPCVSPSLSIPSGANLAPTVVVAGNQSVKSATRIGNISGFAGTLTAVAAGVVARYTRRLKPIIVVGFLVQILGLGAFGLLSSSSQSIDSSSLLFHRSHDSIPSI